MLILTVFAIICLAFNGLYLAHCIKTGQVSAAVLAVLLAAVSAAGLYFSIR